MDEIELIDDSQAAAGTQNTGELYGVVGQPVERSRLPFIHGLFARQTKRAMSYRRYDIAAEAFRPWVLDFFRGKGKGLNVTVPHKHAAAELSNELTPRAERAGAVNALTKQDDRIVGDNTDGAGLVRDLRDNLGLSLANKTILMLGAGSATRGALAPLLAMDPKRVIIANRTAERAQTLAGSFGDLGSLRGCGFAELETQPADLIINATSVGSGSEMPTLDRSILGSGTVCYDMAYGRGTTPFTRWANQNGCNRTVKGWGMLVEQAAESFQLWHGLRPETETVIAILSAED